MYDNGGSDMQQDNGESYNRGEPRDDGTLIKQAVDNEGKMFVGGLSWETDERKLRRYFEKFGPVQDVTIKRDPENDNQSRGFGFILFENNDSVEKVLTNCPHTLDDRTIDPKRAKAQKKDTKLFVGGLNPDTEDSTIRAYFEKFGEIDTVERPSERETKKKRGFCFISFVKDGTIKKIIEESQFHEIDGRQCECKDGDTKKQWGGRGRGRGYDGSYGQQYAQWGAGPWGGSGYDYGSGYGGYGGYSGYGGYGGGPNYGGYGQQGGYGGYTGYGGYQGYGGYGGDQNYGGQQQQQQGAAANSGGKARTAGRGAQSNYKPY